MVSAPIDLSTPGQSASDARNAVGPGDIAHLVWARDDGAGGQTIHYATITGAGVSSAPLTLTAPGRTGSDPQVAVDGSGTAHVTWRGNDGTSNVIEYATVDAGGTASAPIAVSATGQNAAFGRVALRADDVALLAWTRFDGSDIILQAAVPDSSGGGTGTTCPFGTSASVTCVPLTRAHLLRWRCAPMEAPVGILMVGTAASETFIGTGRADIVLAGPGNDVVRARGGSDSIHGVQGDDLLVGGYGHDCILGSSGNDRIASGPGDDIVIGDFGADYIIGWSGDDRISGGPARDYVLGMSGNDRIAGGPQPDRLYGGAGDDVVWGGFGPDIAVVGGPGPGNDTVLW